MSWCSSTVRTITIIGNSSFNLTSCFRGIQRRNWQICGTMDWKCPARKLSTAIANLGSKNHFNSSRWVTPSTTTFSCSPLLSWSRRATAKFLSKSSATLYERATWWVCSCSWNTSCLLVSVKSKLFGCFFANRLKVLIRAPTAEASEFLESLVPRVISQAVTSKRDKIVVHLVDIIGYLAADPQYRSVVNTEDASNMIAEIVAANQLRDEPGKFALTWAHDRVDGMFPRHCNECLV